MKVDVAHIAGAGLIDVPDNVQVGDVLTLSVKVMLYGIERDLIDVAAFGEPDRHVDGALIVQLVATP